VDDFFAEAVCAQEVFGQMVETKWRGAVSDLSVMLNVTFVLPRMCADGGSRGWYFAGALPLKSHGGFLFLALRGRSVLTIEIVSTSEK
jgi:hypothetical protein